MLPGGGVFPQGEIGQSQGNRFVSSIVGIQCFDAHGRRPSGKGYCCEGLSLKCQVNATTVRCVSLNNVSDVWLSTPKICFIYTCVCICLKIHVAYWRSGPTEIAELTLPLLSQLSAAVLSNLVAMCSSGAMRGKNIGGAPLRRPAPDRWFLNHLPGYPLSEAS